MPRPPVVSLGTRRRTSSMVELASLTTWNGSATWVAWGGASRAVLRYGPDRPRYRPADAFSPSRWACIQPPFRARGAAAGDYVCQPAPAGVHQDGAPVLFAVAAPAEHQDLVEAQSCRPHQTAPVRVEQCLPPPVHRCHGGAPAAAQFGRDLADRPAQTGSAGGMPRGPAYRPNPWRNDRRLLVGERAHRTGGVGAAPAALFLPQPHRPPERRQVRQIHPARPVRPHRSAAAPTARPPGQLQADLDPCVAPSGDTAHRDAWTKAHDRQQRTRNADSHRDPPESGQHAPPILGDPWLRSRDPHRATPRANAKCHFAETVMTQRFSFQALEFIHQTEPCRVNSLTNVPKGV